MATVATTPRTNRFTLATTSAGPFLVGFRLFASDGLDVHVDAVRQTSGFTVNATFVDGYDDNATVTFVSSLPPGTVVQFDGALRPGRTADYANPDPLLTAKINSELARLWSSVSEINQLVRRSVRGLDPLEAVDGIDASDLSDLPANLAAAADAASAASAAALEATTARDEVVLIQDTLPDPKGAWLTATAYERGDIVTEDGSSYICLLDHTSGVFATDLSSSRWQLLAQKGAAGAGSGDMIGSNNLSELTDKPLALATIGGQPLDPFLTDIADLTDPDADRLLFWDDSAGEIGWLTPGAGLEVSGTTINATGVPSGAVMYFAMNSAPAGWLKCNGAAVSRTTYAALFAAIGTTFGAGDGSTTFTLPDLRGEFMRAWDDGRGVDSGRVFGSAQGSQNLSHSHSGSTSTDGSHTHSQIVYGSGSSISGPIPDTQPFYTSASSAVATGAAGSHSHSLSISSSGGSEARPRNIALLACIKI